MGKELSVRTSWLWNRKNPGPWKVFLPVPRAGTGWIWRSLPTQTILWSRGHGGPGRSTQGLLYPLPPPLSPIWNRCSLLKTNNFSVAFSYFLWFPPPFCHTSAFLRSLILPSNLKRKVLEWNLYPVSIFLSFLLVWMQSRTEASLFYWRSICQWFIYLCYLCPGHLECENYSFLS